MAVTEPSAFAAVAAPIITPPVRFIRLKSNRHFWHELGTPGPRARSCEKAGSGQTVAGRCCAGGPAPLIAAWLFGTFHSATAIAGYIAICAIITLVATALMTDYTGKDIDGVGAHERRR